MGSPEQTRGPRAKLVAKRAACEWRQAREGLVPKPGSVVLLRVGRARDGGTSSRSGGAPS
eukprot:1086507-Pleurochrysis_carterae.AAC.1